MSSDCYILKMEINGGGVTVMVHFRPSDCPQALNAGPLDQFSPNESRAQPLFLHTALDLCSEYVASLWFVLVAYNFSVPLNFTVKAVPASSKQTQQIPPLRSQGCRVLFHRQALFYTRHCTLRTAPVFVLSSASPSKSFAGF